jgi:hypothetical protein
MFTTTGTEIQKATIAKAVWFNHNALDAEKFAEAILGEFLSVSQKADVRQYFRDARRAVKRNQAYADPKTGYNARRAAAENARYEIKEA